MNIIGKKNIYFLISLAVVVPGLISLALFGLNLSIDFTGGSRLTLTYKKDVKDKDLTEIKKVFLDKRIEISTIQRSDHKVFIRTSPIEQRKHQEVLKELQQRDRSLKEEDFETIGPTIGSETAIKAIQSLFFASILIVLYIAWSFRSVQKPVSSWRFGICAIVALIHDVLVVVGIFSILGHFFKVEVDSLFVTALLTVIGFSVHDTIVVFDRIRENLRRNPHTAFSQVVNESILQTLGRSLNTSLTVLLVLFTMLVFGGETIRWFIVALLIGITSGTYSSIFNASPILVVWNEWAEKKLG